MLQRSIVLWLTLLLVGCATRSAGGDDIFTPLPAAPAKPDNVGIVQIFELEPGKVVSDGVPQPGAGNIEVPDAADIYVLQLDDEQTLFFDAQGETAPLLWELAMREGDLIFPFTRLRTGEDPGEYTLAAGTYIITVIGQGDQFGTYQFLVREP